ncbi:LuxR C-terminal-related transcriptional regulator [Streptomyces sp. NPDC026589]|uniref:LuxR C-terminal-related transcriptional regulator n=1 Tax=Streptomyces sp. NPDC026589 TaxID=3155609 RepID=UPI0034112754
MSHVAHGPAVAVRAHQPCPFCGAVAQPAAALAEIVTRAQQALDEMRGALEAQEQLHKSLRAAPAHPGSSEGLVEAREALALLTNREREILVLIAQGNANRQVAKELGISEKTVKNHLSAVFAKIGASDRTQAVVMGIRCGFLHIGASLDDDCVVMATGERLPAASGPCHEYEA